MYFYKAENYASIKPKKDIQEYISAPLKVKTMSRLKILKVLISIFFWFIPDFPTIFFI